MVELPLPAIVGWLVYERYGGYDAETKILGHMQRILPEHQEAAERFRHVLLGFTEANVRSLFERKIKALVPQANAAILDRESTQFFNQPACIARYDYWARAAFWTVEEAVALTLGRDPSRVNWQAFVARDATQTSLATSYVLLHELIQRWVQAGLLSSTLNPIDYLEWCRRVQFNPPQELVERIEALGNCVIDWRSEFTRLSAEHQEVVRNGWAWHDAYQAESEAHTATRLQLTLAGDYFSEMLEELDAARAEAAEAKGVKLGTRERDSLHRLLIGIAVAGYGYDPKAAKSPIPAQISSDLQNLGIEMTDDTVRKYLKAATALLPGKTEIGVE